MDSLPGNVYYSDLILNPTDSLHTSSLAVTSMHMPWPDAAVDRGPGHLVPGLSFPAYPTRSRPFRAEVPGAFETGDNFDSYEFYPIFPQDRAVEGEQWFREKQKSSSH